MKVLMELASYFQESAELCMRHISKARRRGDDASVDCLDAERLAYLHAADMCKKYLLEVS